MTLKSVRYGLKKRKFHGSVKSLTLEGLFPAPIRACGPHSTLVVPRSAVCEAPPYTIFRIVTGRPIREQHSAAGQKQNNSPHVVRKHFMQLLAINCDINNNRRETFSPTNVRKKAPIFLQNRQ